MAIEDDISLLERVPTLGLLGRQALRILAIGAETRYIHSGELLFKAITTSDNTANDKLMRSVGGPDAVRDVIATKRLGAIRFYNGERALQSRIAGLIWSPSYSIGNAFYEARNELPKSVRKAAFERYVDDPYDGAAPSAIVGALARLKRGELLSPESTRRLLRIMGKPADWYDLVTDRPGHDLRYAIDATKLREETGWRPQYQDITAGLEATVDWYREHEEFWQGAKELAEATYARLGR